MAGVPASRVPGMSLRCGWALEVQVRVTGITRLAVWLRTIKAFQGMIRSRVKGTPAKEIFYRRSFFPQAGLYLVGGRESGLSALCVLHKPAGPFRPAAS